MAHEHRTVFIQNKLGLHARAAVKLVELAQSFQAVITIKGEDDKQATADSVMGLLMLESAQGQRISICADGDDASTALDAVCQLIESKFDESE
ncbi:HPr family phosphocarrier protein [Vibrio metschnikovii]|uniref:HPr family phosphocarrier protein n=1 Tax=Vibrio metschnikovii TaxID=28172 RepID=UPI0001B952EA|nr:HPr family phosphocarrier protein [Vibrio metschnikovii]EEX38222.1 phosphocarrier protein nitrogen regulation associated [Vibrio metschnikovii CIP 69.14]EKO3564824.1 HPr family phosphocarrier protein [Vibrio metschnikovii]EKO3770055.1 HPr family phosphocarrier protein [Vibrio metschnikovii]EKO3793497.1 HPr family phosphocarrier protein [Vibrio metschnikovii]MBC3621082.1 HPr family phosphocarrier protein [Vibrio metschnikovii]